MRLQTEQLKLFLSHFLQVSIVRGSVVIPWLSAGNFFFSVIRAKKDMLSGQNKNWST